MENKLVSLVLYGSVIFDDLAPGYDDLDFLVVVNGNLSDELCRRLVDVRKPLRNGEYGVLCRMFEGAFSPRIMLNPTNTGKALWWGTSGERIWDSNQLGWLVLHVIRERGFVIWGEDIRPEIPMAKREELIKEVQKACENIKHCARGSGLHSVDGLLTAARFLLWLKEGKLSSKSEAADWGYIHAKGNWRNLLPRAKEIRLNPAMVVSPDIKRWLAELTESILEACGELEDEIEKME